MDYPSHAHAVVDALLRVGPGEDELLARMEDALARGYGEALRLDAGRRRLDRRIEASGGYTAPGVKALTAERHALASRAAALREGLAALRECFVALGGTRTDHR